MADILVVDDNRANREALASLRLAMFAKLSATAIVAVFLVVQLPSWRVAYWLALAAAFGGAGVVQYRLSREAPRAWLKYAFMAFDVALLACGSLVRNPFTDYGGLPPQMDLRFESFLYVFIPLALSVFSFTPRFVLFTGGCIVVIWLAAALGSAAGLAEYALAAAAAVVSLFILGVLGPMEKWFERHQAANRRERDAADRRKAERKLDNEE